MRATSCGTSISRDIESPRPSALPAPGSVVVGEVLGRGACVLAARQADDLAADSAPGVTVVRAVTASAG
jgi:hypothetical protein